VRLLFGPKSDENVEFKMLHNEEPYSLYHGQIKISLITLSTLRWAGHVSRVEEGRSAFKTVTGKSTGNIN
jgi:hypothetical protein